MKYYKILNWNQKNSNSCVPLKGHGNEADYQGFLQKSVRHWSLTLHFEPSDFGFEFAEIFVIENESPTRRVGESLTLRFGEPGSC
jgi:hypothetical protein